ncbi:Heavy metal-associated isoprenylated plant protein 26 [Acorus gramineus]|uniref:Heavy metal-associated isoprenylated plant protein 26 n=1 Tax=Acorus gramineus TaxID=55184 RepID=A0AAV9AD45_ACOGR|nr:Heavy metal-associated isoprenylated plant protein 26 [Acorus gramineus]
MIRPLLVGDSGPTTTTPTTFSSRPRKHGLLFFFFHHQHKPVKLTVLTDQQTQTVEIKIRIDCEGCERKVKRSVEGMKGVTQVEVDQKQNKLTVIGYVHPEKVLRRQTTALARASSTEEKVSTAFSDENPNSCSVM